MTVDKILDLSTDNNVKFFALQILDEAINVSRTVELLRPPLCTEILISPV